MKRGNFSFFLDYFSKKLGGERKKMTNEREWSIITIIIGIILSILMLFAATRNAIWAEEVLNWTDDPATFSLIQVQIGQIWTDFFVGISVIIALFCIAIAIVNLRKEEKKE